MPVVGSDRDRLLVDLPAQSLGDRLVQCGGRTLPRLVPALTLRAPAPAALSSRVEDSPQWTHASELAAEDVSAFLGVPVPTPYRRRHTGTGPAVYRPRKHPRYGPADVRARVKAQAAREPLAGVRYRGPDRPGRNRSFCRKIDA